MSWTGMPGRLLGADFLHCLYGTSRTLSYGALASAGAPFVVSARSVRRSPISIIAGTTGGIATIMKGILAVSRLMLHALRLVAFLTLTLLAALHAVAFEAAPPSSSRLPEIYHRRGKILEEMINPPTSSFGTFTVQNMDKEAKDILGPQQPPGWFTVDGVRSVYVVKANSTARTTSAFGFYVRNEASEAKTGATGMFGTVACVVAYSACWGQNPTVIDAPQNGVVKSKRYQADRV